MELSNSLLNTEKLGSERHNAFIQECADDPAHFETCFTKQAQDLCRSRSQKQAIP